MVKITDANLLTEYATLLSSRRRKQITARQYANGKKKLLDKQDDIDFKKEQLARQAEFLKKEAAAKAKAVAKRKAKKTKAKSYRYANLVGV